MTNQEAIKMLKSKMDGHTDTSYEWAETVRIAIKALEQEPSGDLISRQAVIDSLHSKFADGFDSDRWWNSKSVLYAINKVPPVNPTKTGHWIEQDVHNCHTTFECSECGYRHSFMHLYGYPTADYTYCPNCGARMVEPQESEKV